MKPDPPSLRNTRRARTPLSRVLAGRIRAEGSLTFADYMAACLYHPEFGYYAGHKGGDHEDFYTSPMLHPVFGRLLARQFREMWECLGEPRPFALIEAGAGDGRLASHVLGFLQDEDTAFYEALRYFAVEVSPVRRRIAASRLAPHSSSGHAEASAELPSEAEAACIFSNELLDALPVHIVEMRSGHLREVFVDCDSRGEFVECTRDLSTPAVGRYFAEQAIGLVDEQRAEAGLVACDWIRDAGARLGRGFILTIDYGHEAAELYDSRHMAGTLLAYHRHRAVESVFAAPGEQDLTAHVNFTAVEQAGRSSGLARTGLVSQSNFLLSLAGKYGLADLDDASLSETERFQVRLRFKTLIHPEGMGETFRVLIQHKGVSRPDLTGLHPL